MTPRKRVRVLPLLLLLMWPAWPARADHGDVTGAFIEAPLPDRESFGYAGRSAYQKTRGTLNALIVFASFKGGVDIPVPSYAQDFFSPELPGSFSHFYREMSSGQLDVRGTVIPEFYVSRRESTAYLARRSDENGQYARFTEEILRQVDADFDLGEFDNDGPDGVPNSGDDDRTVDYLFVLIDEVPHNFLLGKANGIAGLHPDEGLLYSSNDVSPKGRIRVSGDRVHGTILEMGRGPAAYSKTVGTMAHEFGHALGLPDLYDKSFQENRNQPHAEDSAGIGSWGLMGMGTHGWHGDDGPNPFCAWSRLRLGWIGEDNGKLTIVGNDTTGLRVTDLQNDGSVCLVPLLTRPAEITSDFQTLSNFESYLLVEMRTVDASHYNRGAPASGLMLWHATQIGRNNFEERKLLDLVCADGLYRDAGFDKGTSPNPIDGRDNLDFWAHDDDYTRAHLGNDGDPTDLFDGVAVTRLDSTTNPSNRLGGLLPTSFAGPELTMRRQGDGMVVDIRQPRWSGRIDGEVHWAGDVIVDGDLTLGPDGQLFIYKGTRVRFAGEDRLGAGFDPHRCELRLDGEVNMQGRYTFPTRVNPTTGEHESLPYGPIRFEAMAPGASWYGIIGGDGLDPEQLDLHDDLHGQISLETARLSLAPDDAATAVEPEDALIEELAFELLPNYPNPFSDRTTIPYNLAESSPVRLVVYNSLGQLVRDLVDEEQSAGARSTEWDGRNDSGQGAASGMYLYHLEVLEYSEARKMLLLDGGVAHFSELDKTLRSQPGGWSRLGSELQDPETTFGYAAEPSLTQAAALAGVSWARLQAQVLYGDNTAAAMGTLQTLEHALDSFEDSAVESRTLASLSRRLRSVALPEPALSTPLQDLGRLLAKMVQGHSDVSGAYFFLGEWLEGVRASVQAARVFRLRLKQVTPPGANAATALHLAEFLVEIKMPLQATAELRQLAELLQADPQTRAELTACSDLLHQLRRALLVGG